MFKSACIAAAVFLFALTPVIAGTPTGAPTRDEVIERVNEAVQFYRTNGRERTIAELNRHDGPFAKGMDYVDLHDLNGVCVAHPKSPDLVGQNRLGVADIHGKHFIKEIIDAAKTHQDGWITFMKENPNNGMIEHKIAYWEVHDGLIFKAGTYE
jgi:signal transduction histidine kinase